MQKKKYREESAFVDLIFNLAMVFLMIFIIAYMMINPPAKKSDFVRKAEYIIELEWDSESLDDIDLHIRDPRGRFVWFSHKRDDFIHLDLDDVGLAGDFITDEYGNKKVVYINREIATIRGILSGNYIINIHSYTKRDSKPTYAIVKVFKVNPFEEVVIREFIIETQDQENTVVSFTINPDGSFQNLDYSFIPFVKNYVKKTR
jgi:hypothetical protein